MLYSACSNVHSHTGLYQIDLIVFTYPQALEEHREATTAVLIPNPSSLVIPLKAREPGHSARAYQLLSSSSTPLQRDWNRIQQQPQLHALFHYTWLQPSNSQRPVYISTTLSDGWQVDGTLRVRKSNYYLLDTQLYFSAPNNRHHAFVLSQTQRLKPNTTYYLDHPETGMLIRVQGVR